MISYEVKINFLSIKHLWTWIQKCLNQNNQAPKVTLDKIFLNVIYGHTEIITIQLLT